MDDAYNFLHFDIGQEEDPDEPGTVDSVRSVFWAKLDSTGRIMYPQTRFVRKRKSDPPRFMSMKSVMLAFDKFNGEQDVYVRNEEQRQTALFWLDVHDLFVPPIHLVAEAVPLHAIDQLDKELEDNEGKVAAD